MKKDDPTALTPGPVDLPDVTIPDDADDSDPPELGGRDSGGIDAVAARLPERFELIGECGRGGMGIVYDVYDAARGHQVALKMLRRGGADALYRLKKEFRTLADLHHPNFVELYDLVVDGHTRFFTMELVHGNDFVTYCRQKPPPGDDPDPGAADESPVSVGTMDSTRVLRSKGKARPERLYDEARLCDAMTQLVEGVAALHNAGLIHRDIKPSNVLVTREGRVVLLDFGLVTESDDRGLSMRGNLVGTVSYMSPEQAAQSEDLLPASDWYSVGVLLYEALVGQVPHRGAMVEILSAKQQRPAAIPEAATTAAPPYLVKLCNQLLSIDPATRPGADGILAALSRRRRRRRRLSEVGGVDERAQEAALVGRTAELDALFSGLAVVDAGRAMAVYVRGPSGIGKSVLLEAFLDRCAHQVDRSRDDLVILRGRCYRREVVPFKAMDALVDELSRVWRRMAPEEASALLPRAASLLPRLFPVLGRVTIIAEAPPVAESPEPVEARAQMLDALREVLQRLADRKRVILFLDDLQWVDADTLALLTEIMRPPDPPRLMLLLSSQTERGASEKLEEFLAHMAIEQAIIDVGALSHADAIAVAQSQLGAGNDELARAVARESAGNPFFLGELVRYLQSADVVDSGQLQLENVVQARIALLPEEARLLLAVVAVAGEPVPASDAAAAAGIDRRTASHSLRLGRMHHLLRHHGERDDELVEPYHNRIRESILQTLSREQRAEHHRALAMALEGRASAARLARHWAGAGFHSKAASYAQKAATEAIDAFEFDQAGELLSTALELGKYGVDERRALLVELGKVMEYTGRCERAAEAFLAVAADANAVTRLDFCRRAAQQLFNAGRIERGHDILRSVLADIGEEMPSTPRRALSSFVWSLTRLRARGFRWQPREESEIEPRALRRLDVYFVVAVSLGLVDTLRARLFEVRGLHLALQLGESHRVLMFLALHGMYLAALDKRGLRRSQEILEELEVLCERLPSAVDARVAAYLEALRGFRGFFAGDFPRANQHLTRAETVLRDETRGTTGELNQVRIIKLQTLRYEGRCKELRTSVEDYLRDARQRGDRYMMANLRWGLNRVWLIADDIEGARAALDRAGWSPPEQGYHLQHWYALRARIEVELYRVAWPQPIDLDQQGFARLAASLLTRVQTVRAEAAWLRGRLALATTQAPWDAEREARFLERQGPPYCEVWAALLRAGALVRSGLHVRDPARVIAAYERSARLASDHAMQLCEYAAVRRMGELTGGERGAQLIARADSLLHLDGVANPARIVAMIAPFPISA